MTDSWRSIHQAMTRPEFKKFVEDNAVIKLRLPSYVKLVKVGFDQKLERFYPLDKSQGRYYAELVLKMEDFRLDEPIREHLYTDALLNIQCLNREVTTPPMTLIRILSDPAPLPEPKPSSKQKRIKQLCTEPSGLNSSRSHHNSRKFEGKPDVLRRGNRSFKRYEVQKMSIADIHHLNLCLLKRCINERGKIHSAYRNGLPAKYQRAVRAAVIRARYLALLPYVPAHRKVTTTLSHGHQRET